MKLLFHALSAHSSFGLARVFFMCMILSFAIANSALAGVKGCNDGGQCSPFAASYASLCVSAFAHEYVRGSTVACRSPSKSSDSDRPIQLAGAWTNCVRHCLEKAEICVADKRGVIRCWVVKYNQCEAECHKIYLHDD